MPEATTDPLYARISELLTDSGATVGEPGSMVRALAASPSATLSRLRDRLASEGLRPFNVRARDCDEIRLEVLDSIDRVVSITIAIDLVAQGGSRQCD